MTSSLKLITSKLSQFWKERPELAFPALLFLGLMIHGARIGLTDDEAYYWVLAQKLDLGYAYHPPMVAWLIAASQKLIGWVFGANSAAVVRFPAAFCISVATSLAIRWIRWTGVSTERLSGAGWILISFAGVYALSWMMVPDLPLILGWTIAFAATWTLCSREASVGAYVALAGGVALSILSKYSGILVAGSAGLSILLWAPRERRWRTIGAIFAGTILALLPIVIWNAAHGWGSILYQIRDRQSGGGGISLSRYLRFWLIEILVAGPFLLYFGFAAVMRKARVFRYCWIWALPAVAVFCTQPLWADFKPHWALIGWWPFALALAWVYVAGAEGAWLARAQRSYGIVIGAVVIVGCHWPLGAWIPGTAGSDPRMDVTNDLYGWSQFEAYRRSVAPKDLPVIGSRYQTASQASFALGTEGKVTLLPRDLKALDEWPNLSVSDSQGPDWPHLTKSVLYVADNRYDLGPEFPGAKCSVLGRLEANRGGRLAKWIQLWRCDP